MTDAQQFSVINFYRAFQLQIDQIDTFPISSDNLIVHQDLVKMLGDDEVEFTYPFASIAMDRPRSFGDLLFTLEFYASSFVISVDQQPPLEIPYTAFHLSEKELASALVDVLVGLANGQILVLTTILNEEEPQAVEVIYRQKGAKLYSVLRTFAFFTKDSKATDANYSTEIHRNNFDVHEIKVNVTFLEQLILSSMESNASNRKPFADLDSPLTRKIFSSNSDKSVEIWSQNTTAEWFPGYGKKKSTAEKVIAYTYYRYIEVIAVVGFAITLLTLDARTVTVNILLLIGILVLTIIASIYLRRAGRAMWMFGVAGYLSALGYIGFFLNITPGSVGQWIVAILVFEPIIEMVVADFYNLVKRKKPKSTK